MPLIPAPHCCLKQAQWQAERGVRVLGMSLGIFLFRSMGAFYFGGEKKKIKKKERRSSSPVAAGGGRGGLLPRQTRKPPDVAGVR